MTATLLHLTWSLAFLGAIACHYVDLVIVRGPNDEPLVVSVETLEWKTPPWPCADIFTFQPMWLQRMQRMWELHDPQLHDLWHDGILETGRRCTP